MGIRVTRGCLGLMFTQQAGYVEVHTTRHYACIPFPSVSALPEAGEAERRRALMREPGRYVSRPNL